MNRLEIIEQKLKRRLDPSEHHSFTHLNDVPESWIERARALGSPLLAEPLLTYLTSSECHPYLKAYVRDVVFGQASPQTWRRSRILVPSFSLEQQLISSRAELIAPIGGEFRSRIIPNLEAWRAGVAWVGAPAKFEPDADYRSPVPEGSVSLAPVPLEPITDRVVTLRRWIAGRLARAVSSDGRLNATSDLNELASGLPSLESWSGDAKIAASALLHELRDLGNLAEGVPGFRGPDSWYAGSST